MSSPNSKANTRSPMKRRADVDVYSHPFNAKLPGDVVQALSANTGTTSSTGVTDGERPQTRPLNRSLYPVVPLWSPSSISPSSSREEVDFHTPIFGIAHDVAMSVLDTELEDDPRPATTPRPKRFLLKDFDSPSSNSDTTLPETDNQTGLHPAYAARARWLEQHRDEEMKKLQTPSDRGQVSRNWQPTWRGGH